VNQRFDERHPLLAGLQQVIGSELSRVNELGLSGGVEAREIDEMCH
jgi:hypothetical protein